MTDRCPPALAIFSRPASAARRAGTAPPTRRRCSSRPVSPPHGPACTLPRKPPRACRRPGPAYSTDPIPAPQGPSSGPLARRPGGSACAAHRPRPWRPAPPGRCGSARRPVHAHRRTPEIRAISPVAGPRPRSSRRSAALLPAGRSAASSPRHREVNRKIGRAAGRRAPGELLRSGFCRGSGVNGRLCQAGVGGSVTFSCRMAFEFGDELRAAQGAEAVVQSGRGRGSGRRVGEQGKAMVRMELRGDRRVACRGAWRSACSGRAPRKAWLRAAEVAPRRGLPPSQGLP